MILDRRTVERLMRDAKGAGSPPDVIHFDGNLSGFGLRLRRGAGGRILASFVAQFKIHGRTRRLKIGTVEKIAADVARKEAKKILGAAELGRDFAAEKAKKRARAEHTMGSVAKEYLAAKEKVLRPSSLKVARIYLTGDYFRSLHNMPVAEIELEHVAAALRKITKERKSHTAGAARTALSTFFVWCMGEGLMGQRPINPCGAVNRPPANAARDRVLSDAELAAIWKACGSDDFGRIVQLLVLTGCRRDEIGRLRWSEISFDKRTLALPASRTKNKHAHVLPLSDQALAIIKEAQMRGADAPIFGRGLSGFCAWWAEKRALDQRLGDAVAPWRLHDLRRTAATRMADLGVQPHVIEQVLNHRSGHKGGIAGIYNRSAYEAESRGAVDAWAKHVSKIVARPRFTVAHK
jgi:integrase